MNSKNRSSANMVRSKRLFKDNSDLIDLSDDDDEEVSTSVLHLFDPLAQGGDSTESVTTGEDRVVVEKNEKTDSHKQVGSRSSSTRRRPTSKKSNYVIPLRNPASAGSRRQRNSPSPAGFVIIPPFEKNDILSEDQSCQAAGSDGAAVSSTTTGSGTSSLDNSDASQRGSGDTSGELSSMKLEDFSSPSHSAQVNKQEKCSNQNNAKAYRTTSNQCDLRRNLGQEPFRNSSEKRRNLRLARKHQRSSQELAVLTRKLKLFRANYKHDDKLTNSGLVYSPTLFSSKVREMSVKIIIESPMATRPISFTSNASTTIEHLISHAVCSMFDSLKEDDNMDNYMLKVTGKDEYFDSKLCLADYALVSHCWKFDLDVKLTLIRTNTAKRPYLRTSKDDFHCKSLLCPDDLLSRSTILKFSDLNYESVDIIIETFDRESERLYEAVTNKSTSIQTQSLLQVTKQVCSLMANCETSEITEAKDNLGQLCSSYKEQGHLLQEEDRYKMIEVIQHAIKKLMQNMHRLLKLFSTSLPVDYKVIDMIACEKRESFVDSPIELVKDTISLHVKLVAQLRPEWLTKYHEFHLRLGLMHGEQILCKDVASSVVRVDRSFFPRLLFDQDLVLSQDYSCLPREARFVITLFGAQLPAQTPNAQNSHAHQHLNLPQQANDTSAGQLYRSHSSASITSTTPVVHRGNSPRGSVSNVITSNQRSYSEPIQSVLAVTMSYLFDYELNLRQGDGLLYMHPVETNRDDAKADADIYFETISDRQNPMLLVEFKRFPVEKKIYFPSNLEDQLDESIQVIRSKKNSRNLDQLDEETRKKLNEIIFAKHLHDGMSNQERKLVWANRLCLLDIPAALPKVILSVPNWSVMSLKHIYALLDFWLPLNAVDAIQLLLPAFPDARVREKAVVWISKQSDDELCDYMPQLLQAFRYERSLDCPLLWLLNERALKNVRIANLAYWQIKLNSLDGTFQDRSDVLTKCLLWVCGASFWKCTDKQEGLLNLLTEVSKKIKKVRDSQRSQQLRHLLETVQDFLNEKKPTMPWAPSLEICDMDLASCSYFTSATLPLKLAFRSCERSCNQVVTFHTYDTLFKLGDDMRQDMLAIQMIRIMEKLWLREGLDLRMVTFDCLATNHRQGLVEIVPNAETLRKIHQNCSYLTGPFNQKAINNYIKLWNTSELEYKTAVENFIHSCAGYSVATYILGICDRHNDNIMITTSGHLFHIDFGKFLGDAQMLGSIKRDRTPFVLTADMAFVINGGDKPSKKFQTFIELCTMAFNIIRRNRNIFLNLFSLMSSAKIHGLDRDSVKYIDKLLMPDLNELEAMVEFTRLIEDCLSSRFTRMNFFIHNLAQLKFSNDSSKSLLSFVPRTFTLKTDGQYESLNLVTFTKTYEPERIYYYQVQVKRVNQPLDQSCCVLRTFAEFSELYMKLSYMFPYVNFHDINKASKSGRFLNHLIERTNTREVALRRFEELRLFLGMISRTPFEIAHCDLVYTFFHPILRDQQGVDTNGQMQQSFDESISGAGVGQSMVLNSAHDAHWPAGVSDPARRSELYVGTKGQIKLSLVYKSGSLIIMVMHAKNLVCPQGSSSGPNCYAKTYLRPDPTKKTKKKTRTIYRSQHPSFMELIFYQMPLNELRQFTLEVSMWHSELVNNKVPLGSALITLKELDLSQEKTAWYPLRDYRRPVQ